MAGSRINPEDQKGGLGQSLSHRRKLFTFGRYFSIFSAAALATVMTTESANNINNLGVRSAMAQPSQLTTDESKRHLLSSAKEAATAYRDYLLSGNPASYQRFMSIYDQPFNGLAFNNQRVFRNSLISEIQNYLKQPELSSLYEAFKKDKPHVLFVRMEPAILLVDFILTVSKIRSEIGSIKTPAAMEDLKNKFGNHLVSELSNRMPTEAARMAIAALKAHLLTGDSVKGAEFSAIFAANTSPEFMIGFSAAFHESISSDKQLGPIFQAYKKKKDNDPDPAKRGVDPREFAAVVSEIYKDLPKGDSKKIETLKVQYDNDSLGVKIVEPVATLYRLALARRAASTLEGITTASTRLEIAKAGQDFSQILKGTYLGDSIINDNVFFDEFKNLYREKLRSNVLIGTLALRLNRNFFAISLRDIYTSLAKNSDRDALKRDYGSQLVNFVFQNYSTLGWLIRPAGNVATMMNARASEGDAVAKRLWEMSTTDQKGKATSVAYSIALTERMSKQALGEKLETANIIQKNFTSLSWLSKPVADLSAEYNRLLSIRDPTAIALANAGIQVSDLAWLSTNYNEIVLARTNREAVPPVDGRKLVDLIDKNFDQLSWLSKLPGDAYSDFTALVSAKDKLALALSGAGMQKVNILQMNTAYAEISGVRQKRAAFVTAQGKEGQKFYDTVSSNLQALSWIVRPVEQIDEEMGKRNKELLPLYRNPSVGYSVDGLSRAFYAIYLELGKSSPDRAALVAAYGENALKIVQANYSRLNWKNERDAQENISNTNDPISLRVGEANLLYSFTPTQLSSSMVRARLAISASALEKMDVEDSLGTLFVNPVTSRVTISSGPVVSGNEISDKIQEISNTYNELEAAAKDVERQLGEDIFVPARAVLREHLWKWRRENERLKTAAESSGDHQSLKRISDQQDQLRNQMVNGFELRKAAELAFAMIHLAETGGDINSTSGFSVSSGDTVTLQRLLAWYESTGQKDLTHEKQSAIGDVVASVLYRATPELYRFINSMDDRTYPQVLGRLYSELRAGGLDERNRVRLNEQYGSAFVAGVESNLHDLRVLENPAFKVSDIPPKINKILMHAYRKQDNHLYDAVVKIYEDGITHAPTPQDSEPYKADYIRVVNELREAYGPELVRFVFANQKELSSIKDPNDLHNLKPGLEEGLNAAFDKGPGPGRANFMYNFHHVADVVPQVYVDIKSALSFSNAVDSTPGQVGSFEINLRHAVEHYRSEFGASDYLFGQYINLDLLNKSVGRLAKRYNLSLTGSVASRGLRSPEDMVSFLTSESGRSLVAAGHKFYDQLETNYLMSREKEGTNVSSLGWEYSDDSIKSLRNQLSILDALYLGVALEHIGGTDSAFSSQAARATMDSVLLIAHRDPYLVGPYLLNVLPALIEVCPDEKSLVAAITAFNNLFSTRYQDGMRDLAYSTSINRKYFLEVFEKIGKNLPIITSTYDHTRLQDELRRIPEPLTDESYLNPFLYRYKPSPLFAQPPQIPNLYGVNPFPFSIDFSPTAPTSPSLPVPGGFTLDSGARAGFTRMYEGLRPPTERLFRLRVPSPFKIDAIGEATIIRSLTKLFGPMPTDYSSYWLSHNAEAGGFGSIESDRAATTSRAGAAALGVHRGITGGVTERAIYTGETKTDDAYSAPPLADQPDAPPIKTATSTVTRNADVEARAGGIRLGVPGADDLIRSRALFHHEFASTDKEVSGGTMADPTSQSLTTALKTSGLFESYSRIARNSGTDMLLLVAGEHVPELKDSAGTVVQTKNDKLKTRAYILTPEGGIYQVAYGLNSSRDAVGNDTSVQILNYLFGNTNQDNILASLKFMGSKMLTSDSAAHGFDGAAVGITIPRGVGDNFAALTFGELVRNINTMDPLHVEQAAGMAITDLLSSKKQRSIYAGFYRGTQVLDRAAVDPKNPTAAPSITGSHWSEGTGELMWRTVRIDPLESSWELRLAGGGPQPTIGARYRREDRPTKTRTTAYGLTLSHHEVDLLQDFRAVSAETDKMYTKTVNSLVHAYHWSEDEARNVGWLVSASYMYSQLENWVVKNPDGSYSTSTQEVDANGKTVPRLNPNYVSVLMMYWANRHGILVGGERVPGFRAISDRIDRAMNEITTSPENEQSILEGLSKDMQNAMKQDIWKFALGYGYDGEQTRIYVVAAAGKNPAYDDLSSAYGSLYGLVLFGRPTSTYFDVAAHAFQYAPVVITESGDAATGTARLDVQRQKSTPYTSLYGGFGVVDWPAIQVNRYEHELHVSKQAQPVRALRDCYVEFGSDFSNFSRLEDAYGKPFVTAVRGSQANLSWVVRPVSEIDREISARLEEPAVRQMMVNFKPTIKSEDKTADLAKALADIYSELRAPTPDVQRLESKYGKDLVSVIRHSPVALEWVLLPEKRMDSQFKKNSEGVLKAIADAPIKQSQGSEKLSGGEVAQLFEQNMAAVVLQSLPDPILARHPENYDVILGAQLQKEAALGAKAPRYDHLYMLVTGDAANPGARYSLRLGNDLDLEDWQKKGYFIGRGIVKVEIKRSGDGYDFVFSGDRRMSFLTAARVVGGITLPLNSEILGTTYQAGKNFTVGGLVQLLQDQKGDWLAGALYGIREFGNEDWKSWKVATTARVSGITTEKMSSNHYFYIAFNRTERKVIVTTQEEHDLCVNEGKCDLGNFSRTTIGTGYTWARANISSGSSLALHLFFEGGVESRRDFYVASEQATYPGYTGYKSTVSSASDLTNQFVFRAGVGVSFSDQQRELIGSSYTFSLTGARGTWPNVAADITQEETMQPYATSITNGRMPLWIMGYAKVSF